MGGDVCGGGCEEWCEMVIGRQNGSFSAYECVYVRARELGSGMRVRSLQMAGHRPAAAGPPRSKQWAQEALQLLFNTN